MSKVFITGGTGFIGNNLVKKLLERGFQIKALVRNKTLLDIFDFKDKIEIIYGDILEPESFHNKINDCEFIIHSAALIAWARRNWEKIYKINVIGTRNILLEALKAKCKKFIHISTIAAIGFDQSGKYANEKHEYNWSRYRIPYMETKHQAELEVYNAIKKGLNAVIVNPSNVWGQRDYRGRRTPLIKALKFGFPFYLDGGTNFVDVDAVCEATINALEFGKCGERYILGGDNLSIRDFLNIICDEINVKRPFIKIGKLPIALYSYFQEALSILTKRQPKPAVSQLSLFGKNIYYDSSKAVKELKMPVISFRECIRKTIRFYKEQKMLI